MSKQLNMGTVVIVIVIVVAIIAVVGWKLFLGKKSSTDATPPGEMTSPMDPSAMQGGAAPEPAPAGGTDEGDTSTAEDD